MGVTVLAPPPMVLVPGRLTPMPLFRPPARAVAGPPAAPAVYRPPPPSHRPAPAKRWRVAYAPPEVQVPGRATPMPMAFTPAPAPPPPVYAATGFATSVVLVPAGGTNVTSTPANLMIGPITYIQDFTIHTLDAGVFIMNEDWPSPKSRACW